MYRAALLFGGSARVTGEAEVTESFSACRRTAHNATDPNKES